VGVIRIATALAALACLWAAATADAATLEKVGEFEAPVYVTSDPGNPERLFVVQRGGKIVVVEGGSKSTFADLSSVVSAGGEGGLLSIALAPDFDSSGRLFVDYTSAAGTEIHVAELRTTGDGGSAPLSTLRNLLTVPHPEYLNHYGGQLQFGPEGMLFVSTGDGGGGNDVNQNAQDLESGLGKILRIYPNSSSLLPYTVPSGNPFAGAPGSFKSIVWSYGLRNPFRFSFDRLTGDLYVGDVGEKRWEEVDSAAAPGRGAGADYGWNCLEAEEEGEGPLDPQCAEHSPEEFVKPIFAYPHTGGRCAIIGGYVSRDPGLAGLYGRYLYGDFCSGELRSFNPASPAATDRSEGLTVADLNSFGEDSCGRLYAVSGNGPVYRLTDPTPTDCGGAPQYSAPLRFAYVGIKAHGRRIRHGKRALLTAWVSPCAGRKGEPVTLWRGRAKIATKRLDRACVVRFRPRITRRSAFRARVEEDESYLSGVSRALKVKVAHHKRHAKHRRA
jgi:glucose/arabinose dehydrogenase